MEINLKELLEKFTDGERKYNTDEYFKSIINALVNGVDPIKVIDLMVQHRETLTKLHDDFMKTALR